MSLGVIGPSAKEIAIDNTIEKAKTEYYQANKEDKEKLEEIVREFINTSSEILRHYSYRIVEIDCSPKHYVISWAENNKVVLKIVCFEG